MWDNVCRNGISMGILYHFMPAGIPKEAVFRPISCTLADSERCSGIYLARARGACPNMQIYFISERKQT